MWLSFETVTLVLVVKVIDEGVSLRKTPLHASFDILLFVCGEELCIIVLSCHVCRLQASLKP